MRKKGQFWVCPEGCFSALGLPTCEHMHEVEEAAGELLKMVGLEESDPLDELLEIVED